MTVSDPSRLLDDVATWCAVCLTAAVAGRTLLGLTLAALGRLPGTIGAACDRAGAALTPVVVRRLLVGVVGMGAAAAAVAPASPAAARQVAGSPVAPGSGVEAPPALDRGVPGPGRSPAWPDLDRAAAGPRATTPVPRAAPPRIHVVSPGDTLWGIAAASLPPDASAARIDREWRRWYRANRAVIGSDPDLIIPGQRLVAPPSA